MSDIYPATVHLCRADRSALQPGPRRPVTSSTRVDILELNLHPSSGRLGGVILHELVERLSRSTRRSVVVSSLLTYRIEKKEIYTCYDQ
jgi:hypothetical protein